MRKIVDFEGHFWSRVDKSGGPDACWSWTGYKMNGYGQLGPTNRGGSPRRAHRVAYELAKGAIPEGKLVMHTCDNPPCCNPAHLIVGTPKMNAQDAARKLRMPHGEAHVRATVTDATATTIRTLAQHMGDKQIAQQLGLPVQRVRAIARGRSFVHNPTPPVCRSVLRLDRDVAAAIRKEYATTSISYVGLSRKYGCDIANISRILHNKIYVDPDYTLTTAPKLIPAAPKVVRQERRRAQRPRKNPDWGNLKDGATFQVSCPPDLEDLLRIKAAVEGVKVSVVIRAILREYLSERKAA